MGEWLGECGDSWTVNDCFYVVFCLLIFLVSWMCGILVSVLKLIMSWLKICHHLDVTNLDEVGVFFV